MAEGEVLCLDAVTERFVQQKSGSYELAKLRKFSYIDIQGEHCLSVSDKGEGFLHVIVNEQKQNQKRVALNKVYSFTCSERVSVAFLPFL